MSEDATSVPLTDTAGALAACGRGAKCQTAPGGALPAGTELHTVFAQDHGQRIYKKVCAGCKSYYMGKLTALRAGAKAPQPPAPAPPGPPMGPPPGPPMGPPPVPPQVQAGMQLSPDLCAGVRQGVVAGWQQGASVPIQAVGGYHVATPQALVPAMQPVAPGYTAAHQYYHQQKSNAARNAHQVTPDVDTVPCTISVVYLGEGGRGGKGKPNLVGDVCTGMNPVHISLGVAPLRELALAAIRPHWDAYTRSTCPFPAGAQLIVLSSLVPLHAPPINDVSALLHHVVKKGKSYQPVQLAFRITFRDFEEMQTCMTEHNVPTTKTMKAARATKETETSAQEVVFTEVGSSVVHKRTYGSTREDGQPTTPPRKFAPPAAYKSPEAVKVHAALAGTADISYSNAVQVLYDHQPGKLYPIRRFASFDECLQATPISAEAMGKAIDAELHMSKTMLGTAGAFKASFAGTLRGRANIKELVTLLGPKAFAEVCVKEAIEKAARARNFTLLSNADALVVILKEVRNLEWAISLQHLVEAFIAREVSRMADEGLATSAPTIPTLRFVDAAMFIYNDQDKRGGVVLLETKLNVRRWRKYIGNGNTKLYGDLKGKDRRDGEFLSFCQHVQWVKTDGQVFIADYQGADGFLTDPQIITCPEFTDSFADGNVLAGWQSMVDHHVCNDYCKFFGLIPPAEQEKELEQRRKDAAAALGSGAVSKAVPTTEELDA